jgi:hypothetical protein
MTQEFVVQYPPGSREVYLHQRVRTGPVAHRTSCSVGTGDWPCKVSTPALGRTAFCSVGTGDWLYKVPIPALGHTALCSVGAGDWPYKVSTPSVGERAVCLVGIGWPHLRLVPLCACWGTTSTCFHEKDDRALPGNFQILKILSVFLAVSQTHCIILHDSRH